MDYLNILTNYGFYCYHSCSCTGTREESYRHNPINNIEFKIYPKRLKMQTKINRKIVCQTGLENLQSEIDKYV